MTSETVSALLGWSSIINICVLFISAFFVIVLRGTITRIHSRLFAMNEQDLGRAYFQYLGQYKIAIILFNIAPWIALQII